MAKNIAYKKKKLLLVKTALKLLIINSEFYDNGSVYMEQ